ncbi:MAG TPA: DNA polymerase/3'-5' exonuclease PolX [Pirellulales bacterium]|jgi:DNA polymerase (family 10)|nr:DNA polymerase/3'-5' exonuclease PolX [Pirellulales bacterium]
MTNIDLAVTFDEIADLLEFTEANPFRVRAYRNAARTLRDLPEPVTTILQDANRKLTEIEGIGKDLAEKIKVLVATGDLPMRQELLAQVPASAPTLLRVPGLGPKKAAVLVKELNIKTLDELRAACEAQRVRGLKGFGAKTEQTILVGLASASTAADRMYWAEADEYVTRLLEWLRAEGGGVSQLAPAGSYRRGRETVGDVDLLAVADDGEKLMDRLRAFPGVAEVLGRGDTKMSVRLGVGLQVDLRVVPEESFGAALQYFTGSKDHNVVLRGRAKARGLKINEYGVFRGDEQIAGRIEEEVYATLDLPCFPPELREARREFDWAARPAGLPKLIELADLVGDLHMHTDATDGSATLDEMVEAAKARGLKYIAITDHSKRVSMAGGLDADRLLAQWEAIDRLNARKPGITVLRGIECDILERGGLDLPDDVLREADWVLASLHYGQKQPRDQITRRLVEAIRNPYVSAIAHPTGRIINRRKSYDVDLEAVFREARDHGKLLELNANPARLDLDDVNCAAAKNYGIPIIISTDAHSTAELDKMRYGVLQARRGGLTVDDVANTRSWPKLKKLVGK